MSEITKVTLAKEIDGSVRYFYPSTSSDIVFYDDEVTIKDKIDTAFDDINTLKNNVSNLQTTVGNSSSGLVKDNNTNKTNISALQTTVGNSSSGLVKDNNTNKSDISTLKTTVGGTTSGLVKDVNDLKTTVGDNSSGLVKSVADNTSAINTLQTTVNGKSTVTSSTTNGNIKINGTETTVYTPSNIPAANITESSTRKFVTNDEKNKINTLEGIVNDNTELITAIQQEWESIDTQYVKCLGMEYNTLMDTHPSELVGKIYEFTGSIVQVYGSPTLQQQDNNSVFHLYTYPISFPGYSNANLRLYRYIQILQKESAMAYGALAGNTIPSRQIRYWMETSEGSGTLTHTSWIDSNKLSGLNIIDYSTKISSMAFVENTEKENTLSFDYLSSPNGEIDDLNDADTRVPTSAVILNSIGGHSFSYGEVASGQYVYGYNTELGGDTFYTITGSYYLIGKFCFLNGCVFTVAKNNNPWYDMYYPLPVAFYRDASTLAWYDNEAYIIHTTYDKGPNTYLHVSKIVRNGMQDRKPLNFTLIYRYAE